MTIALTLLLFGFQVPDDKHMAPELAILELRLEVSTPRTVLDPADLLPLNIRWINGSKIPLKLQWPFFKVFMQEPGGGVYQTRSCERETVCCVRPAFDLAPGEFFELAQFWSPGFLSRREPAADVFRRPAKGRWKVWIEYEHRYGVYKSDALEFRIEDDPARTPEERQAFGSEAWHRFALGGGAGDADFLTFRKIALSRSESPQKDIMAYMVGHYDLSRSRPGHATTLLRIAGAAKTRNVNRWLLSSALVQCYWELGNYDEALTVTDQNRPDPADIARKQWDGMRAGILRAKQTEELFRRR